MKKTKEEILNKHFEKEYGFQIPENRMAGFQYVFDSMNEFRMQELSGEDLTRSESKEPTSETETDQGPDNPKLRGHKHIPFHGGWITWRGRGEPSEKQMAAFEEMAKLVQALDARDLKDLQDG